MTTVKFLKGYHLSTGQLDNNSQNATLNTKDVSTHLIETTPTNVDLLALIIDTMPQWQVHRCQITDSLVSQHQPMKFIYHYEHLSDLVKLQYPLTGELLASFDQLMTREAFAQRLGIHIHQVANPWQIKFFGKLVVFYQQPEIALRLHWVNTIKAFEPIYPASSLTQSQSEAQSLHTAIEHAFGNWQITAVEVIQKNPQVLLSYPNDDNQSILPSAQFVTVPATLANAIIDYLQSNPVIAKTWLTMIKAEAQSFAENNNLFGTS